MYCKSPCAIMLSRSALSPNQFTISLRIWSRRENTAGYGTMSCGVKYGFCASGESDRTSAFHVSGTGKCRKSYLLISTGSNSKPMSNVPRSMRSLMLSELPL